MGGDQAPPKPPPVLIASGPPSGPPGMLIQFAPSQSQTIALCAIARIALSNGLYSNLGAK